MLGNCHKVAGVTLVDDFTLAVCDQQLQGVLPDWFEKAVTVGPRANGNDERRIHEPNKARESWRGGRGVVGYHFFDGLDAEATGENGEAPQDPPLRIAGFPGNLRRVLDAARPARA